MRRHPFYTSSSVTVLRVTGIVAALDDVVKQIKQHFSFLKKINGFKLAKILILKNK